ncbi:MAG: hypothetical protein KJN87_06960 [Desulfofustis sp.]|nr:hypothetical protein [Desulfofustis sp.]
MDHQHQLREAKILCASGQLYKGIESFNRVEEQGSDIVDTCLGPGAALVALRRFNEAEEDFSIRNLLADLLLFESRYIQA